jgi:serine/threonine protein phosphatase PrpC
MKKSGLINVPFIHKTELAQEDLIVVIASDGVWDVITDLDAFNISKSCKDSRQMCEYLVKESMSLGSRDNISCISIFL